MIALASLTEFQWMLLVLCACSVGIAKAGIPGITIFIVPLLALVFGGKLSSGLLLPMLSIGDFFVVKYYNRHAQWKYLFRLLPWSLTGVAIGVWVGDLVPDVIFKEIIAIVVFVCVGLMVWQEKKKNVSVPDHWWFPVIMGLFSGFATMIGNAAGPILALYFLSMHLPKNTYIGTAAWFSLIVNLIKIPLHVFVWGTITWNSILVNITMAPMIGLGAFTGIYLVKKIPERPYRLFIIIATAVSAMALLL